MLACAALPKVAKPAPATASDKRAENPKACGMKEASMPDVYGRKKQGMHKRTLAIGGATEGAESASHEKLTPRTAPEKTSSFLRCSAAPSVSSAAPPAFVMGAVILVVAVVTAAAATAVVVGFGKVRDPPTLPLFLRLIFDTLPFCVSLSWPSSSSSSSATFRSAKSAGAE